MFDLRDLGTSARALVPTAVELNPIKFYSLIDLANSAANEKDLTDVEALIRTMADLCEHVDRDVDGLAQINNSLLSEVRNTTRRKDNPFKTDQEAASDFTDLRHTISGRSFLHVIFNVASIIQLAFHELKGA